MTRNEDATAKERRIRRLSALLLALAFALLGGSDRRTVAGFTDRLDAGATLRPGISITPLTFTYPGSSFTVDSGDQTITPTVDGGNGPKSFSVVSGTLPPGVTLDPSTGALTATGLTLAGSYQAGAVDPGFAGAASEVFAVAVQADGKVLVGGTFTSIAGTTRNRLARFNADGSLDPAFNPNFDNDVYKVQVLPDGRMLVGGLFGTAGGVARARLVRLFADGTVDTSFDAGIADGQVQAIAIAPDGSVTIGGTFQTVDGRVRNRIARVSTTGALDLAWDPNANNAVIALHLADDGRLFAGGNFTTIGPVTRNRIARFNPDGSLDASWNPNSNNWVTAFEPQADGQLLVGGFFTSIAGTTRNRLARLNADGSLDPAFNPNLDNVVRALIAQPDGSILVAGEFTSVGGTAAVRVVRLSAAGAVDPTFAAAHNDRVMTMATAPDGTLITGGRFTDVSGVARSGVARLGGFTGFPAAVTVRVSDFSGSVNRPIVLAAATAPHGAPGDLTATAGAGSVALSWTAPTAIGTGAVTDYRIEYSTGAGWRTVIRSPSTATAATIPGLAADQAVTVRVAAVGLGGTGPWATATATPFSALQLGYADTTFDLGGAQALSATVTGGSGPRSFAISSGTLPAGVSLDPTTGALTTSGITYAANWSAGAVDPGYDPDLNNSVSAIAVQPDGKVLAGGAFTTAAGYARPRLVRLLPDGTPDVTFTNPNLNNAVTAVAIQPDGKILAGGTFTIVNGTYRNRIARLNPDGTLDTTFDPNLNSTVSAIALQPDGRIVIGGAFTTVGGATQAYLARLNADGTRDASFDVVLNNSVSAIVVQPDGAIVAGGAFTTADGVNRNRLLRLDASGNLDLSWDPDLNNVVGALALQPDGRIVVGGTFTTVGGVARNRIARVTSGGALDTGFNPNCNNTVSALALHADGRIVAGGLFTSVGGTARNRLAMLGADGTLDTAFNPNADSTVSALAVQSDGRVVAGGSFLNVGGVPRNRMVRLGSIAGLPARVVVSASDTTGTTYAPVTIDVTTAAPGTPAALVAMSGGSNMALSWSAPADTGTGPLTDYLVQYTTGAGWTGAVRVPSTATFTVVPGFTIGTTYTFRVAAVNVGGAGPWSDTATVTAGPVEPLTLSYPNATIAVDTAATIAPTTAGGFGLRSYSVTSGALPAGFTLDPATGVLSTAGITYAAHHSGSTLDQVFDPVANSTVTSSVVQPDGRIVIGGVFSTIQGTTRNRLARLLPDGTLDLAYNPNVNSTVSAIVAQPDGKLVISGAFTTVGGVSRLRVARLNADGTLDTTFDPGTGANNTVSAVAVQPDGKILIGGAFTTVGGVTRNRIARLNTDGTLDTAFDPGAGAGVNSTVNTIALQPDGRIVIGGAFTTLGTSSRRYVARLFPDGTTDTAFTAWTSTTVNTVVVQPDGNLLLGGLFTTVNGVARNYVARVLADGSLDTGFNPAANLTVTTIALLPDGSMLLGGSFSSMGGTARFRVARVSGTGALDTSFVADANGTVSTIVITPEGRAIVGGDFTTLAGVSRTRIGLLGGFIGLPSTLGITVSDPTASAFATFTLSVTATPAGAPTGLTTDAQPASVQLSWTAPADTGTGPVTDYRVEYTTGGAWTTVPRTRSTTATALVRDLAPGTPVTFRVAAVTVAGTGAWSATASATPLAALDVTYPTAPLPLGTGWSVAPVRTGGSGTAAYALAGGSLPAGVTLDPVTGTFASAGISDAAHWASGELDAGFDLDLDNAISAMAMQGDGKAVLGGSFTNVGGVSRIRIARLNADGTLDTTFTPGAGAGSTVSAVAVQPDGKILIGGAFTIVGGTTRNRIARLNTDGTLDTTFDPGTGANNTVSAVAVQPDGKILIGGAFTTVGGVARNRIARLDTDGTLDTTFDPNASAAIAAIALQADGRILIGGSFTVVGGQGRSYLARLEPTGAVDQTFYPNPNSTVTALLVEPDGRVLVAGSFSSIGGFARLYFARLDANGVTAAAFPAFNNTVSAIARRPDGRIVVGGSFTTAGGVTRNRIAQVDAGGTLDASFAPSSDAAVAAVAVLPDGRVLAGGSTTLVNGTVRRYLARFGGFTGFGAPLAVRITDGSLTRTVPVRLMLTPAVAGAPTGVTAQPAGAGAVVGWTPPASTGDGSITDYRIETDTGGGWRAVLRAPSTATTATIGNLTPGVATNVRVTAVTLAGAGTPSATVSVTPLTPLAVGWADTSFDTGVAQGLAPTVSGGSGARTFTLASGTLPPGVTLDASTGVLSTTGIGPSTWRDTLVDSTLALDVNNLVTVVVVQSDGKTVIGGQFTSVGGVTRTRLARLNADGTLDTTFVDPNANNTVNAVAVQPDGKILIGGAFATVGGVTRTSIARLNADGTLDTTFNATTNNQVSAIAVQPDGKILIGGSFTTAGGVTRNRIARLNTDGTLDTTFVDPNANSTISVLTVLTDGKILAGGAFTTIGGGSRTYIARLNADGTLDTTFNATANNAVYTLAVLPDGRVLAGGAFTLIGGASRSRIALLTTTGTNDASFNPSTGPNGNVVSIVRRPDGRIVLGGGFTTFNGVSRTYLAQLAADGTLDTAFAPAMSASSSVHMVALTSTGRIVAGGSFTTIDGLFRPRVVRLGGYGFPTNLIIRVSDASGTVHVPLVLTVDGLALGSATATPSSMSSFSAGTPFAALDADPGSPPLLASDGSSPTAAAPPAEPAPDAAPTDAGAPVGVALLLNDPITFVATEPDEPPAVAASPERRPADMAANATGRFAALPTGPVSAADAGGPRRTTRRRSPRSRRW